MDNFIASKILRSLSGSAGNYMDEFFDGDGHEGDLGDDSMYEDDLEYEFPLEMNFDDDYHPDEK